MKSLVIIVVVLALTTAVYGFDAERLRKFTQDFMECNEELGGSSTEPRVDTIKCATVKDGGVFNASGEYIRAAALARLGDLISDVGKLEEARAIMAKCYDDAVQSGITGDEQTMKIIECSLPNISKFNKSQ